MVFSISCLDGTLEIYDGVERRTTQFAVDCWLPTSTSYPFRFPADETFSAKCSRIGYDSFLTFVRRSSDYKLAAKLDFNTVRVLPKDEYIIEVDAHCKVYIRVNSSVKLSCGRGGLVSLAFEPDAELVFGVRSFHRHPTAKIYTTKRIGDLADAISLLSSSIKVANCERSYPTLRGHPPLIEFAREFSADLEKEYSGVEITIPPKLEYLFTAAPLAYYLLADISFGSPAIKAGTFEYTLTKFPKFEDEVNDILQRVFFLDCLVRNAGLYKLDLRELDALEGLNLDLDELYSLSVGQQLPTYLSIPAEKIAPYMPRWHLSSYVEPLNVRARGLPFLLHSLSAIYLPSSKRISQKVLASLSVKELIRGDVFAMASKKTLTQPNLKGSEGHIWLAKGMPIDVTKADEEAFYNRLRYDVGGEGIEVALVVNDEMMLGEKEMIRGVYARRKDVPIRLEIYEFAERDELARVFEEGFDLVHFIGHCQKEGLRCSDGFLQASEIRANNTRAFFLNACKSYEEGIRLIKSGSTAGVVTLYYVPNEQAIRIGYNFTRLLSLGFPIERAMDIAKSGTLSGRDYLILGDGSYSLVQNPKANTLYLYDVRRVSEEKFHVTEKNYGYYMGGYFFSDIDGRYYLCRGEAKAELRRSDLIRFLAESAVSQPIRYENKLLFTGEFHAQLK